MFTFSGRASRSAFIWPVIFGLIVIVVASLVYHALVPSNVSFGYIRLVAVTVALPLLPLGVRRLHDMGMSGWWALLWLVPYVGFVLTLFAAFKRAELGTNQYDHSDPSVFGQIAVAGGFVALVGVTFAVQPFWIPAGSMKPTVVVGDYITVSTTAYGLPCFGLCGDADRMLQRNPGRGDVVVFKHPVTGRDFIKRVIAVSGDTVALEDGQVVVNGAGLTQTAQGAYVEPMEMQGLGHALPRCRAVTPLGGRCAKSLLQETTSDGRRYGILDISQTQADSMAQITVPDGMIFVLGDNRDNSADSRMAQAAGGVGFVPVENLVGRATRVVVSNAGFALWDPTGFRGARFWTKIR
ncbi:signal peptidase I [Ascidiaceihabitans sp.]|uniref:signal peptidase I n=1 Tax=Ascidiaceihabitans sp. TaxID=1872644 RepID=UPI00329743A0